MTPSYKKTKYACYFTYLASASVFSLPPILLLTFQDMYGISYTLCGTLVLVNFCTQLAVDLVFSFFGSHFDPHKALRFTPLLTSTGLLLYALIPLLFPSYAFAGLLVGTMIFSVAAGLAEALISPTVAALPSEHPEKDMAALHSLYGYGVVMVVVLSTLFLRLFGRENWMYLTMLWAILPVFASVFLILSPMPPLSISQASDSKSATRRRAGILLCFLCIFFGGATEGAMTTWVSTYMESVLEIPKVVGDIVGLALFATLLALTRTWYAKYGKNIYRVLLISMAAAIGCYLLAGLSPLPAVSMAACVLTGVCTSMLWPGTLIMMEEKIPHVGVAAYALMAAGGDLGVSIAPQTVGIIVDTVKESEWVLPLCEALSISPEQAGLKIGMLVGALFPICGVVVLLYIGRYFRKQKNLPTEAET